MTIIHANDPTTQFLSQIYEQRKDVSAHITETSTNSDVMRAIRGDNTIMMLGHGNEFGLFSKPDKDGKFRRYLITTRHVEFLRGKTCIGIWCFADKFAIQYKLHGLFSGMIISELKEAENEKIVATKDEIDQEMEKFSLRLKDCIERYELKEVPERMKALDDVKSELTVFNYNRLYYLE